MCGRCAGVMAVVMLLGAFPFDHARQHEGAVDDEALDLWCGPVSRAPRCAARCRRARNTAVKMNLGTIE